MVNPSSNNTEFIYEENDGLSGALVDSAKSAVILLFILLGIVLNLLLVVAVCKETKFHRPSFFFLLNLSSAELVRSVLCLPFYFIALVDTDGFAEDNEFCKSASFFYTLLAYETMFTLMSLAMARYSIIAHQNFHKKKLTKFVCVTVIAMTWTLAVIMTIPPIFRAGMPSKNSSGGPHGFFRQSLRGASVQEYLDEPDRIKVAPPPSLEEPLAADASPSPPSRPHLGPCSFSENYFQSTDTLGFTIVFTIVLVGIHLIYLRIFIFMRQHRKMNPTRRAPAISDNWTFFGPGAAPILSSSVSSHFQSAIVQGVSSITTANTTSGITSAQINLISRPNQMMVGNHSGVATGPPDAMSAIESYHLEEKITKTTYFLTCSITSLWCPYIVVVFIAVINSNPVADTAFFLATFLTFFQSAVTPLVCLIMLPPVVDLACDMLKTIKCRRRNSKNNNGNPPNGNSSGNPLYENLSEMVCSTV